MSLAFYASPIDFSKNEKTDKKSKKPKLDLNALRQMTQPKEEEISKIHENVENDLKQENDTILSDYYAKEVEADLKTTITNNKYKQDLYQGESVNTDYLISNNLNTNIVKSSGVPPQNELLLSKINHIIEMFEEQKEIRTNQKNEEVILYCFLGIFVIYVLDSFVYIGKYKR